MDRRILSTLIRLLVIALALAGGYGLITRLFYSDRSLITHEPCAPPCWYGITPGVTTREEALDALHAVPFVWKSSIRLRSSLWKDAPETLQESLSWKYFSPWMYLDPLWGGSGGGIWIQDGIVVRNRVTYMVPLRLGEVVQQNGEPDLYRVGIRKDYFLEYIFYYQEIGLIVYGTSYDYKVINPGGKVRATISERFKINYVIYHPPMNVGDYYQEIHGYSLQEARRFAEWLKPWPGMGATVEIENY